MATAAKRQPAIPPALSKELTELALREGKSVPAFLRGLLAEHKRHRLSVEFKEIQNYWGKKAKAKGLKTIRSLNGVLKGLSTENIREKPLLKEPVISYLEPMTQSVPIDAESLIARALAIRRTPKGMKLNDRLLTKLKVTGRP